MITRALVVLVILAQLAVVEIAVLRQARFTAAPGGRFLIGFLIAITYVAAIVAMMGFPNRRALRYAAYTVAALLTIRFYLPMAMIWLSRPPVYFTASDVAPRQVSYLRQLAVAQEQFRLRSGRYGSSLDSLAPWLQQSPPGAVEIRANAEQGWSARLVADSTACEIWVRDSTLRARKTQPEGSPICGTERRAPGKFIRNFPPSPQRQASFAARDVNGTWSQHRADAARTGIVNADVPGAFRWNFQLGGEPLASPAVAGNQVFLGAHGNGEFVALTLDSGKVGYRIRVPNWIHHEPVVTRDLVVISYGNNEESNAGRGIAGSSPSGLMAIDRRTGVERWRHYTRGSAMASPAVHDALVMLSTTGRETVAWRLRDGVEQWRTATKASTSMGNPLLLDSMLVIGMERTSVCMLRSEAGVEVFCHTMSDRGWGAGHASPAAAHGMIYQVFDQGDPGEGTSLLTLARSGHWGVLLRILSGLPARDIAVVAGEQVLVALDGMTGRERWRVSLGPGHREVVGHIAGTPTVSNGTVYVPSPTNGRIVAVGAQAGNVIWSVPANPSRGSVLALGDAVLSATSDSAFVVLDAATGQERCRQRLPAASDRAGPTVARETGILALRNGLIMARPVADWLSCRA
jgi:outer membrane protein assembly factor BamB